MYRTRQETKWATVPPMAAERLWASDVTAAKRPRVAWRSAYGTVAPMYANVSGTTAAAKTPVTNRIASSQRMLCAWPVSKVPTPKPIAAPRTTRIAPSRSPSGP